METDLSGDADASEAYWDHHEALSSLADRFLEGVESHPLEYTWLEPPMWNGWEILQGRFCVYAQGGWGNASNELPPLDEVEQAMARILGDGWS